jgi:hypothetical protein
VSDLIRVSDAMDSLKIWLAHPASGISHLLEIDWFIRVHLFHLSPASQAFPFLLELSEDIERELSEFSPLSIPSSDLVVAAQTLGWASEILGDDPVSTTYQQGQVVVEQAAFCSLCFMGDYPEALHLLSPGLTNRKLTSIDVNLEPAEFIRSGIRVLRPEWIPSIDSHIRQWNPSPESKSTSCYFPVVSAENQRGENVLLHRGFIREASFLIHGMSDGPEELEILVQGEERDPTFSVLDQAVQGARQFLKTESKTILDSAYRGFFRFSTSRLSHEGNSVRLALAALYVCETQRYTGHRRSYRINPTVALTGDLDSEGNVLDVDLETIPFKVRALFFSPLRYLVVPLRGLDEARKELGRLQIKYPNRSLSIVGIESLVDLFSDRRLVSYRKENLFVHTGRTTWRNRHVVLPTGLFACLLALVLWTQFSVRDKYPATVNLGLSSLEVANDEGVIINHIQLLPWQVQFLSKSAQPVFDMADFNRDGYGDVVWIDSKPLTQGGGSAIHLWDGKSEKETWLSLADYPLDYVNDPSITKTAFIPNVILIADMEGDGNPELFIAAAHVEYYPSVIVQLNPLTGEVINRYDHPGGITALVAADLDEDGKKDVLFGGVNNAYQNAVVGILDGQDINGIAPAERYYLTSAPPSYSEKAYIRFKGSRLMAYSPLSYPTTDRIRINELERELGFEIRDSRLVLPSGLATHSSFVFHVNFDLVPITVGTGDVFDRLWERAYEDGYVDTPLTTEVKIDMMQLGEIATPTGWVNLSEYRGGLRN